MRHGHVGWEEFNRMTPPESVALSRALGELVKQEQEFAAALAGTKLR